MNWDDLRYFLAVARTEKVSEAGRLLGVEHTTVSRRIRVFEKELGVILFEKSRRQGFTLTPAGHALAKRVEVIERHIYSAVQNISQQTDEASGHIRIATTEGFGSFVLTPLAVEFQQQYPNITLDIMPFQRSLSESHREADIFITIDKPLKSQTVYTKLCDYHLFLYGSKSFLNDKTALNTKKDVLNYPFIGYVDELVLSQQLKYLPDVLPEVQVSFKSNSLVAQYYACLAHKGLAILPSFMARHQPELIQVLAKKISIERSFWLYYHEDLRKVKRIELFVSFLKAQFDKRGQELLGENLK